MEALIVYPATKEEMKTIKTILKALKIKCETSVYDETFVKKINIGKADIKAKKTTKVTLDEIWK